MSYVDWNAQCELIPKRTAVHGSYITKYKESTRDFGYVWNTASPTPEGGRAVVVIMWTIDEAGKAAAIAVVQWLGTYIHFHAHTHALTGMIRLV